MNSNEIKKNICNAFEVVRKTQQSIDRLISKLYSECENQNYCALTERFIRYNSDNYCWGWCYGRFVLLFQHGGKQDKVQIQDAPVYAVCFDLDNCIALVAKMKYKGIEKWRKKNWAPNRLFAFENVLFSSEIYGMKEEQLKNGYKCVKIVKPEKFEKKWFFDFECLIKSEFNLVEINNENFIDKIFGTMDELDKIF